MAADDDLAFDFEEQLEAHPAPSTGHGGPPGALAPRGGGARDTCGLALAVVEDPAASAAPKEKNYRQTVCAFWLRGMCMKGESCGFLHKFDPERMPVCRVWMKTGECKELECPFKHSLDDVKECNMYKLGFCIYGPNCRFKHTKQPGPPPDPATVEACKPREARDYRKIMGDADRGPFPGLADGPGHKRRRGEPVGVSGGQPMLALPAPQQQPRQQPGGGGGYGRGQPPMHAGQQQQQRPGMQQQQQHGYGQGMGQQAGGFGPPGSGLPMPGMPGGAGGMYAPRGGPAAGMGRGGPRPPMGRAPY